MVKNKCPENLKEIVDLEIMLHNGEGYHKMVDEIKSVFGKTVKTCHIADRKRALGYPTRWAWNSSL